MTEAPEISLLIPAYNEARYLPRLLDSAQAAAERYGAGRVEIIVADNGSTDATAELAAARGCTVVPVAKRLIAAARNGAAAAARGRILAFVDADSLIHPDSFTAIAAAMADEATVGGATGVRFDRASWGIDTTVALVKPMVRLLGLDSGIVFCRAEDFRAVGGYPEDERIAEDVKFLLALKALGRRRGQRFRVLEGVATLTSARKFDEHGDWHFFRMMPGLTLLRFLSRRRFDAFVERYWYRR